MLGSRLWRWKAVSVRILLLSRSCCDRDSDDDDKADEALRLRQAWSGFKPRSKASTKPMDHEGSAEEVIVPPIGIFHRPCALV